MKTLLILIMVSFAFCFISCGKTPPAPEPPVENKDSIACAEKWKAFQLPFDTLTLQMKLNDTFKIIDKKDTFRLITEIYDWCSEESSKSILGCTAEIKLKVSLNNNCEYNFKEYIRIPRYDANNGDSRVDISTYPCNCEPRNKTIYDESQSGYYLFYNFQLRFRRILPFIKTDSELKLFDKKNYISTIYIIKRCQ
jgi:hypothetical protein